MIEVSNNSLGIYRSCQKKFHWHYIEGLRPIRKSSALSLGTVLHDAFNMYYNKFNAIEVLSYITKTMDDQIANASPDEAENLQIIKYTLVGMWTNYPLSLAEFTKIEPEMEFKVKIPGMRGVVFVGKVDGLVTDSNGKMWIRELKSTALGFSDFEKKSKYSPQGTGYIWAMRQLGYPIEGVLYDFVKKPLLRKGVNEKVIQFGERIMKDYKDRPDVYYKRHFVYHNQDELELFQQDLTNGAVDIRRKKRLGNWHRNQDSCWDWNQECPYLRICFQKVPDPLTVQLFYKKEVK